MASTYGIIIRLFGSIVTLAILIGANAQKKKPCPVNKADFDTESGVEGAIMDGPGNPNVLYFFKAGQWPTTIIQCHRACKRWPSPKGVLLSPINGESGPCSYWVWMGGKGCYLFGCGVCRNYQAFVSAQNLPKPANSELRYCSGGGPGRKQCDGGVKGDPHYTGGDKSHFEFTGVPGKNYCLVSDKNLHINVYYGGRYDVWGNITDKPLTWIRKVAVMWKHHTIVMEARKGPRWQYDNGYMSRIEVDGKEVVLAKSGDYISLDNNNIQILWAAAKKRSGSDEIDEYRLTIKKALRMNIKVRPEIPILRTSEDGVVHFTLQFPAIELSDDAHGILGQTYREDHMERLANQETEYSRLLGVDVIKGENGEGYLDGKPEDYESTGLLNADCAMSRFVATFDDTQNSSLPNDVDDGDKITTYRK